MFTSIQVQTYVVCGVMIGCFSILYPKVFHPLLLQLIGVSKPLAVVEKIHEFPRNPGSHSGNRPRPSILPGGSDNQQSAVKRGGIMSLILPVYGVGIVLYLLYTLSKVFKSKQSHSKQKRDEFLRHYYRDFHYDASRGKFRMGHGSSEEDEGSDTNSAGNDTLLSGSIGSCAKGGGRFDWASAYGSEGQPDIYRSAKDLPRDLEALLLRLEKQDLVDDGELSRLRTRLEQTEMEMTKLLEAMDKAEQSILRAPEAHHEFDSSQTDAVDRPISVTDSGEDDTSEQEQEAEEDELE